MARNAVLVAAQGDTLYLKLPVQDPARLDAYARQVPEGRVSDTVWHVSGADRARALGEAAKLYETIKEVELTSLEPPTPNAYRKGTA